MRRFSIVIAAVGLLAAAGFAPGPANGAAKKYRFKFTTPMQMDWQWPANPHNRGRRDSQSFRVKSGSGCGTRTTHAVWKIVYDSPGSGLPQATLKIDLIHVPKNPAKVVDAHYSGEPSAEVQGFLKFSLTKVTLFPKVIGSDVVGPHSTSATATISKHAVSHC